MIMNAGIDVITAKMSPGNDAKTLPKKDPDDNANLPNYNCIRGQCTGAIPKTKTAAKANGSTNNYIKVNNNVDKAPAKKCSASSSSGCSSLLPDNALLNNHLFPLPLSTSRTSTGSQCCLDSSVVTDVQLEGAETAVASITESEKYLVNPSPTLASGEAAATRLNPRESDNNSDTDTASSLGAEHDSDATSSFIMDRDMDMVSSLIVEHDTDTASTFLVEQDTDTSSFAIEHDTDTDTANEDAVSVFDDGCIYTYKGDQTNAAFPNLEQLPALVNGVLEAQKRPSNRSCSPETDYLEMDFDPGQPCDDDFDLNSGSLENMEIGLPPPTTSSHSHNSNNAEHRRNSHFNNSHLLQMDIGNAQPTVENELEQSLERRCSSMEQSLQNDSSFKLGDLRAAAMEDDIWNQPGPSGLQKREKSNTHSQKGNSSSCCASNYAPLRESHASASSYYAPSYAFGSFAQQEASQSDASAFTLPQSIAPSIPYATTCTLHQASNGTLLSPPPPPKNSPTTSESLPTPLSETPSSPSRYINDSPKIPQPESPPSEYHHLALQPQQEDEEVTIWTRDEAVSKQTMQVAPSACGATAVINVLRAFDMEIPSMGEISAAVATRKRAKGASMRKYLWSRSIAGSTHEDLIAGLEKLTGGKLYSRFFHMYPERNVNLRSWLSYWMRNGAIPIATLNLQKGLVPDGEIPDAWHHQMIYGIDSNGILLTNPLECKDAGLLWHQLSSESVLLIRRADVMEHWTETTDLRELMAIRDVRWRRINVVGQVANMIREDARPPHQHVTQHIRIPASYSSGITLVVRRDSAEHTKLSQIPELPLLQQLSIASQY